MPRAVKPAPTRSAVIASDKADADAYVATRNLDPDEVVVLTPKSGDKVRGVTIDRVYLTRSMVDHPDRNRLSRSARGAARVEDADDVEDAADVDTADE